MSDELEALRDRFAGQVAAAYCTATDASGMWMTTDDPEGAKIIAERAYNIADALLAARSTTHTLSNEALRAENARIKEALVQHNDMLRSAASIADRDGKDTNWLPFRGQCHFTLAEYHDLVNEARAALGEQP